MGVSDESTRQTSTLEYVDNPSKASKKEHPELFEGLTRVQYMVESGVTEVPNAFIQPPHMRSSQQSRNLEGNLQVPLIDMALLNQGEQGKKKVQEDITHACEEWGFFSVINHGVPASLMDASMAMAKKFFALPPEEKEVYKVQSASGAVGYGRIFEEYRKPDEIKEWLDRLTMPAAKDSSHAYTFVINNPSGFQEVYDEYGEAVYELGKKLMAILSEELGQKPEFLLSKIGNEKAFLRTIFNYYPPCPQPELVMGSPPHADGGALTILQQGEVPGLQVLHDGVWIPVPPSSDHAFVVNIGDTLQIISNERFKSVLHRAVVQNTSRISIPNFMTPDRNDLLIEPASELCSKMNPPLFKGVTFKDYIVYAVSQGYGRSETRAVEHFRL